MEFRDVDGFSAYMLKNDRRNTTIKRHLNTIRFLFTHLEAFEQPFITDLLLKMKQEGKANAYLNTIINTIRVYSQYTNLSLELQKYKQFKKITGVKATLSDDEIEAFLSLPCPFHADKRRWQTYTVFWSVIAFCGMRPGECAKLKASDFDFGRGVIQIRISKTNQPGIVPMPANLLDLIKGYIYSLDAEDYLYSLLN